MIVSAFFTTSVSSAPIARLVNTTRKEPRWISPCNDFLNEADLLAASISVLVAASVSFLAAIIQVLMAADSALRAVQPPPVHDFGPLRMTQLPPSPKGRHTLGWSLTSARGVG
jgi:hypothetical protein